MSNSLKPEGTAVQLRLDKLSADGGISNPGDSGDCDYHEPSQKLTPVVYERAGYEQSGWGRMLAQEDLLLNDRLAASRFRRRFRIPYPLFVELMKAVEGKSGREPWFNTPKTDMADRPYVLKLKVLGVLQILARGNCFDDVTQCRASANQ